MTAVPRRAATPARVWVSSTALPGAATLMLFWLSRAVETEAVQGWCFASALTFLVITCTIGPIVCWAWRTRALEDRVEDDNSDVSFRLQRAENDLAAVSLTLSRLLPPERRTVNGNNWVPPGPTPPSPPLYVVRDDEDDPRRWN